MSITKPFTFVAGTKARANEVNQNFDVLYSQVNSNISAININANDIDTLDSNKANINGSSSQRFACADPASPSDAVNKQSLTRAIGNSINYIDGYIISKDSGSPDDTIIVSAGSAYDSTHTVVLNLNSSTSKQNLNQGASTTYYVYIIGNSTGSSTDILISTSSTTPTLPSGYTLFRLIGSYTTDADSKINNIYYYGVDSSSDKSPNAYSSASAPNYSARFSVSSGWTATANGYIYIYGRAVEGSTSVSITIGGLLMYLNGYITNREGGHTPGGVFPIKKGDYMTTSGIVDSLVFIPCVGG